MATLPFPKHSARLALLTCLFTFAGCVENSPNLDRETPINSVMQSINPEDTSSQGAEGPIAEITPADIASSMSQSQLWLQLQQKKSPYFVLIRHTLAPGTGDPAIFQLGDCSTQRNLSDEGREQAVRTGEVFDSHHIVVDRVLSSQWCRCLETATLMDVGEVEPFPPLNSFFGDRSTEAAQTNLVQNFMLNQQGNPGVTVMVTHFVNIAALSGIGPSSGEMVVIRLNDKSQLEVLGAIEAL